MSYRESRETIIIRWEKYKKCETLSIYKRSSTCLLFDVIHFSIPFTINHDYSTQLMAGTSQPSAIYHNLYNFQKYEQSM